MDLFLTGTTGFVGGEVLVELAARPEVNRIFCLVRADSPEAGAARLRKVFALHNDPYDPARILPVVGDMADPDLTLKLSADKRLADVGFVLHAAAVTSFSRGQDNVIEKVNILGLKSLLSWAKTLKKLDVFAYVGTATIRGKGVTRRVVGEDESPDPNAKHLVKYTHSKALGESMLKEYLPEDKILVIRPSIIMGDSRGVIPRSNIILWTMAAFNLLRMVPGNKDAKLDIIPVDYAAKALVAILFAKRNHRIYHISSGTNSFTTPRLLGEAITPLFDPEPPIVFVAEEMLDQMRNWARNRLAPDSPLLAYKGHLDHWDNVLGGERGRIRIVIAGLEPYLHFMELEQLFDNSRLLADTSVGPAPAAHDYVPRGKEFLAVIDVFEGALHP